MNRIFLLIFCLLSTLSYAQYTGPFNRTMEFRLYGKDAQPIDGAVRGMKVSYTLPKETRERNSLESRPATLIKNKISVWFEEFYPTNFPIELIIEDKEGTMRLKVTTSIDSLIFTPGSFEIPDNYNVLFSLRPEKCSITNQNLSFFRIPLGDTTVHLPELKPDTVINNPAEGFIEITSSHLMIWKNEPGFLYLSESKDGGKSWKKNEIFTPTWMGKFNCFNRGDQLYFVGVNRESSAYETYEIKDKTMKRNPVLSSIFAYSIRFINDKKGFAIGKISKNQSAFYSTKSGGEKWTLEYEFPEGIEPQLLEFCNDSTGYVFMHEKALDFYKTTNRGKTWSRYIPIWPGYFIESASLANFHNNNYRLDAILRDKNGKEGNYTIENSVFGYSFDAKNELLVSRTLHKGMFTRQISSRENKQIVLSDHYVLYSKDRGSSYTFIPESNNTKNHYDFVYSNHLLQNYLYSKWLDHETVLVITKSGIIKFKPE